MQERRWPEEHSVPTRANCTFKKSEEAGSEVNPCRDKNGSKRWENQGEKNRGLEVVEKALNKRRGEDGSLERKPGITYETTFRRKTLDSSLGCEFFGSGGGG